MLSCVRESHFRNKLTLVDRLKRCKEGYEDKTEIERYAFVKPVKIDPAHQRILALQDRIDAERNNILVLDSQIDFSISELPKDLKWPERIKDLDIECQNGICTGDDVFVFKTRDGNIGGDFRDYPRKSIPVRVIRISENHVEIKYGDGYYKTRIKNLHLAPYK